MNARLEERITVPQAELEEFCRRNHVRKLAFFGSVLRDDFRPDDSDVDVLVWFDNTQRIGYLTLVGMEMELSKMLGRKVDLRTPEELNRYFREEVVRDAEVLFAA
jgi:predicted nucleotidyltransferase